MKQKLFAAVAVLMVAVVGIGFLTGMTVTPAANMPPPAVAEFVPNEVDLYFPTNPTTGYDWEAEAEDPDIVEIKDQFFEYKHDDGLVGVGGTHWFHVSGLKPGVTSVAFRYLRAWDPDSKISETVYRLTVDEQMNVMIWGVEVSDLG